jgi:carbon-monoxide dehydrogenase medium subunit
LKAPSFDYARPRSLSEVFDLIDMHGDGARLLAGGQSLLAILNMRMASPKILIDIAGLPELKGITLSNGTLRIGALVTHTEVEQSDAVAKAAPLLAMAVPHIAHVAIRNAGTFGGSIALADPAAEYPACLLTLRANVVAASRSGERRIAADDFFRGLYSTALSPGELIIAGEIPPSPGCRSVFLELARRQGDYASVGIAAHAKVDAGRLSGIRLAFLGVGDRPTLARKAAALLEGETPSQTVVKAASDALASELDPPADLYTSKATKLHLARVLLGRAVAALVA